METSHKLRQVCNLNFFGDSAAQQTSDTGHPEHLGKHLRARRQRTEGRCDASRHADLRKHISVILVSELFFKLSLWSGNLILLKNRQISNNRQELNPSCHFEIEDCTIIMNTDFVFRVSDGH